MTVQPAGSVGTVDRVGTGQDREAVEVKLLGQKKSAVESPLAVSEKEMERTLRDLPEEKVAEVARVLNQVVSVLDIEAQFSVHERSREIMVTLINKDTREVVRQIPPEKVLDMLAQLKELVGILFDEVI